MKDHLAVAVPVGDHLAHAVEVHDGRAMDARESSRVQATRQLGEGFAQEQGARAEMQLDVVSGGADPIHLLDLEEDHAIAVGDGEATQPGGGLGSALEERIELSGRVPCVPNRELVPRAFERDVQTGFAHRLQEVVDRVRLEGADRVVIEGGDEDDARQVHRRDSIDHRESVSLRHLDVEEEKVGPLAQDSLDRLESGRRFSDHLDIGSLRESDAHAFAREGLVVGQEDAHQEPTSAGARGSASAAALSSRYGSETRTTAPPVSEAPSSIRCLSP